LKKFLESASGLLAGLALFAIMVLTFLDVGGRKLLDHSITGSLEMTELLMVVVIFGALPLVSERGEHVVFDSLDVFLPKVIQKVQRSLVHLLCGVALIALGWLMWQTGHDFSDAGAGFLDGHGRCGGHWPDSRLAARTGQYRTGRARNRFCLHLVGDSLVYFDGQLCGKSRFGA
jgi:hypothetical protein